jgi:protein-S-isoprenylcysteine O-methyltransferase Ste14
MYIGVAVLTDALWPLILLSPIVLVVDRAVIRREERYLERKFGDDYLRYKLRTRRGSRREAMELLLTVLDG